MSADRTAAARFHVDAPLPPGAVLDLPPGAARHVQVLRLQPGAALRLFNGRGGEVQASIERMGRSAVAVRVEAHDAVERELPVAVTLALGVPANDRMDALIEKATELGAAAIVPLLAERAVLRLAGERAERRVAHWRGVAVAACEQCGRNRVPEVAAVQLLAGWLRGLPVPDGAEARWLLTLATDGGAPAFDGATAAHGHVRVLSGPEGGQTDAEEALARAAGFVPVTLGPRVLRADTAPLALLAWVAVQMAQPPAPPSRN